MTSGLCTFAWTGSPYGNEILAVRFDALGPLDPAPLLLAKGSFIVNLHAGASPDAFLFAYRDVTSRNPEDNEVRVVALGRDGAPGTTPVENGQLIFTDFVSPGDVVWWADQWLLTWTDQPEGLISPVAPDKPGIGAFPFGESWDPATAVREAKGFGIASVVQTSDTRRGVSQRIVVRLFAEARRGRGTRPGSGDGDGKVEE
jgi:hypothetical protein